MNGGSCLDASNTADVAFNADGYKCLCPAGYTGNNCEGKTLKEIYPMWNSAVFK